MNFQFNRTCQSAFLRARSIRTLEEVEEYLRAVYDHESNAIITSRISQVVEENNRDEESNGLEFAGDFRGDECQGVFKLRITGQRVAVFYFHRTKKKSVNGDLQVTEGQRIIEKQLHDLRKRVEILTTALQTIRDSFWSEGETGNERVSDLKAIAENALKGND